MTYLPWLITCGLRHKMNQKRHKPSPGSIAREGHRDSLIIDFYRRNEHGIFSKGKVDGPCGETLSIEQLRNRLFCIFFCFNKVL